MTDEQINIAIAEACGWKPDDDGAGINTWDASWVGRKLYGMKPLIGNGYLVDQVVPDYCNDLNAMREAEETLVGDSPEDAVREAEYCHQLFRVINPTRGGMGTDEFSKLHATARERAEAFLRTIGKWEESES